MNMSGNNICRDNGQCSIKSGQGKTKNCVCYYIIIKAGCAGYVFYQFGF